MGNKIISKIISEKYEEKIDKVKEDFVNIV